MPRPRAPLPAKPQPLDTPSKPCLTWAAIWRSVDFLRLGQHQIVPAGAGSTRCAKSCNFLRLALRQARHRSASGAALTATPARSSLPVARILRALKRNCAATPSREPFKPIAAPPSACCHKCFCSPASGLFTLKRSRSRSNADGSRPAINIVVPMRSASSPTAFGTSGYLHSTSNSAPVSAASRCHKTAKASSSPLAGGKSSARR